jgi:hypothetical protein
MSVEEVGFARDSPLEGDGFELSVPLRATAPAISFPEIRNPFSSQAPTIGIHAK